MKRFSKNLSIVLISLMLISLASIAKADLNDGLVAYWSFDNCDARDDSGNGHDGIIYGNPECVEGISGMAFKFDGVDDYIKIPYSPSLNLERYGQFTIVVLAKADRDNGIYNKGFYDTPNGAPTLISKDCSGDPTGPYNLYMRSCNHQTSTQCISFEIQNNNNIIVEKKFHWPKITADEFHSIVWRHYNQNYEIWLDGELKLKVHSPLEPKSGNNCLLLARRGWFNGYFKGTIDEIRIYNRALSEEEIQKLYEMGLYGYAFSQKPPYLEITSVRLSDEDGNRIFEGGERATLTVRISNFGKGTARNMKLRLFFKGLKKEVKITKLEPDTSITKTLSFKIPLKVKTGKQILKVELQAGKYSPEPVKIAFFTKAPTPPHFKIAYRVDDDRVGESIGNGNGIVEPRETVELFVDISNTGKGFARDVELVLKSPDLDILTGRAKVGNLPPGGKTTAKFVVFVPSGFNKQEAHLSLRIKEALGIFGANTKLSLNIGKKGSKFYAYTPDYVPPSESEKFSSVVEVEKAQMFTEETSLKCVKSYPNRYLFVSVVYDYDELSDLDYVKNDIALIKTLGKCYLAVPEENIKILKNPSVGKFKKELRKFVKRIRAKDAIFYFYYSGHGVLDGEGKFYFLPSDASIEDEQTLKETAISIDELRRVFAMASGYKVAFIDACRVNPPWKPAVLMYKPLAQKIAFLFSTKAGKISNADKSRKHSAFTRAIYEMARAGVANVDLDGSGYVEIKEIKRPLRNWLKKVSASPDQTLDIWGFKDIPLFPVE